MTTIEQNKTIAKFMNLGYQQGMCEHPTSGEYDYPAFDCSWDWLMPVVEKIEELGYTVGIVGCQTISGRWYTHSFVVSSFRSEIIVEIKSDYSNNETKISTIYRGVIIFIQQYNENKEL
jgi:hypothetical protein